MIIVRYVFLYQKKRYRHQKDVLELQQNFTQTLLQSKIEIQEQTLNHISKELHANFSHLVSLININLSEILPNSTDQTKGNILETKALTKQLMSDLKSLSASLNTEHIMKIGLVKALEQELHRLHNTRRFKTTIVKKGEEFNFSAERETILLRLCQEALNNILKHAKATSIVIALEYKTDYMELSITDDGMGFDLDEIQQMSIEKQSTGFTNMEKRAALIGGSLRVSSTIGQGTKVIITLPK